MHIRTSWDLKVEYKLTPDATARWQLAPFSFPHCRRRIKKVYPEPWLLIGPKLFQAGQLNYLQVRHLAHTLNPTVISVNLVDADVVVNFVTLKQIAEEVNARLLIDASACFLPALLGYYPRLDHDDFVIVKAEDDKTLISAKLAAVLGVNNPVKIVINDFEGAQTAMAKALTMSREIMGLFGYFYYDRPYLYFTGKDTRMKLLMKQLKRHSARVAQFTLADWRALAKVFYQASAGAKWQRMLADYFS